MKLIAIALLAVMMGFGALIQDAEAKRMGGGRSTGFSRDSGVMNRQGISSNPAAGPAQTAAAGAAAPQSGMGPLDGANLQASPQALASQRYSRTSAWGAGMGNMLLILAVVAGAVFAVRWLMRKRQSASGRQPAMQFAGPAGGMQPPPQQGGFPPNTFGGMAAAAPGTAPAANVPADFDVEGFLRQSQAQLHPPAGRQRPRRHGGHPPVLQPGAVGRGPDAVIRNATGRPSRPTLCS